MARSKDELVYNATRWMQAAKREKIKEDGVGAIFMFFNLNDPTGSAVCVGSVNRDAIKAACKGILKKIEQGQLIINPYERN